MAPYELRIGFRYLRAGKETGFLSVMGWITIGGILLGVMALVVALSFASGFEGALREKIIGINAHLLLLRYDGPMERWREVERVLEGLPGVSVAVPFTYHKALIRSADETRGIVVRGVPPGFLEEIPGEQLRWVCGRGATGGGRGSGGMGEESDRIPLWIGKALGEALEVGCGDEVRLVALSAGEKGERPRAALRQARIAGIFEIGMYEYDASLALLPLAAAQDFFSMGDRVTGFEIRVEEMGEVDRVGEEIRGVLGYPFWVKTWKEINPNFFSALRLQKVVMFLVLILIVLVGGFNIISTLIMNVIEKRAEVAILKAMGATRGAIGRIFFFQGLFQGGIGTGLGLLLGYGVCLAAGKFPLIRLDPDIYYLSHLPVEIRPLDFVLVGLASLVLTVLSTVYPARQAAKLDPAEVLRYE